MLPALSHRPPTLHSDVKEVPKFALFNGKEAFAIFDYTDGQQKDGNLRIGPHPLTLICFLFWVEALCDKEIFCLVYFQLENNIPIDDRCSSFQPISKCVILLEEKPSWRMYEAVKSFTSPAAWSPGMCFTQLS